MVTGNTVCVVSVAFHKSTNKLCKWEIETGHENVIHRKWSETVKKELEKRRQWGAGGGLVQMFHWTRHP